MRPIEKAVFWLVLPVGIFHQSLSWLAAGISSLEPQMGLSSRVWWDSARSPDASCMDSWSSIIDCSQHPMSGASDVPPLFLLPPRSNAGTRRWCLESDNSLHTTSVTCQYYMPHHPCPPKISQTLPALSESRHALLGGHFSARGHLETLAVRM